MQLTRYSDYSLRVLIHLAVSPGRVTIEDIAAAYDISRGHLMKVVQHLAAIGVVETLRGRGGGLRLARNPEEVNVGDLIRRTEENLSLVECFRPDGRCPIEEACVLRTALQQALAAFLAVLDGYTLADLVAHRRARLARLLDVSGPSA